MEDHPQNRDLCSTGNSIVNRSVLTALLDMGDRDMQRELCLQLHSDLTRIAGSLVTEDRDTLAAATHELKGLSATIGAMRLSENAQTLNSISRVADTAVLDIMARTIRQEISEVLEILGTCETN